MYLSASLTGFIDLIVFNVVVCMHTAFTVSNNVCAYVCV